MKAILFDLDGTLIDSNETIIRCINTVLKEYSLEPFEKSELKAMIGISLEDILKRKTEDFKTVAARYRELHRATYFQDTIIIDGIPEFLKKLIALGYKIGIVTMRYGDMARFILEGLELIENIEVVIGWDEVTDFKPSPVHTIQACNLLKVEPRDCVYVGDSKNDMLSGKAAGCTTIGVLWGSGKLNDMIETGAMYIAQNLDELYELLRVMK